MLVKRLKLACWIRPCRDWKPGKVVPELWLTWTGALSLAFEGGNMMGRSILQSWKHPKNIQAKGGVT